jgi:hypothetical protein
LRFVIYLLAMMAVALTVGFGLSYYALTDGRLFAAYEVGPWAAWPDVGSPSPDPYTRAYLARTGSLQLGLTEGLQFVARSDSAGFPLERTCRYRIQGTTPVASFWTLVPTDPDGVDIARPDGPPAFHSGRLSREEDGSVILYVSRSISPQNWLEISGEGLFELVLTLYDSSIFAGVGSVVEALPTITREACL